VIPAGEGFSAEKKNISKNRLDETIVLNDTFEPNLKLLRVRDLAQRYR